MVNGHEQDKNDAETELGVGERSDDAGREQRTCVCHETLQFGIPGGQWSVGRRQVKTRLRSHPSLPVFSTKHGVKLRH